MKYKKGVFFTLIAILFIDIFLFSYRTKIEFSESEKMESIRGRVLMANDFIKSLEKDASRAQYIAGFRTMVSLNNFVSNKGIKGNLDSDYPELMLNGTLRGNESNLMVNQTMLVWIDNVKKLANKLKLNLTINISQMSVSQNSPWSLFCTMNLSYFLNDSTGFSSWNRSVIIKSYIPIYGWQDPLYALRTGGGQKSIYKSNFSVWNVSNLLIHMQNETFVANSDAPSFLFRIENKTEANIYGIESVIDASDLGNEDNLSVVDYIFFNISSSSNTSKISGISDSGYPEFRLDDEHAIFYDVVGEKY